VPGRPRWKGGEKGTWRGKGMTTVTFAGDKEKRSVKESGLSSNGERSGEFEASQGTTARG